MTTDTEKLARIGELLRLRELIMATYEEQLEHINGRLRQLYPPDFLQVVAAAEAQGQERPDFLEWYAERGART